MFTAGVLLMIFGGCAEPKGDGFCEPISEVWDALKEEFGPLTSITALIAAIAFVVPFLPEPQSARRRRIVRETIATIDPAAVRWVERMSHGVRPAGIPTEVWSPLEDTGLFERDQTGPKGIVPEFKNLVARSLRQQQRRQRFVRFIVGQIRSPKFAEKTLGLIFFTWCIGATIFSLLPAETSQTPPVVATAPDPIPLPPERRPEPPARIFTGEGEGIRRSAGALRQTETICSVTSWKMGACTRPDRIHRKDRASYQK